MGNGNYMVFQLYPLIYLATLIGCLPAAGGVSHGTPLGVLPAGSWSYFSCQRQKVSIVDFIKNSKY